MRELPRIFVNIAGYRDTELPWTIKDLFEKARHPERVFAGICRQYAPGEDDDAAPDGVFAEQCRVYDVHAKDSLGVCWARHQTQKLWRGEEYAFQIDSHMRFVVDWDEVLLDMLGECDSARPVLTTYPVPYTPPDKLDSPVLPVMFARFFDNDDIVSFGSRISLPEDAPEKPQPSAFVAAGFLFGPSKLIADVPYDPRIYFQGEETNLAVRLWTHGWDFFTPNKVVCYHDFSKRPERPRHWEDKVDWRRLNTVSKTRLHHLLGMEKNGDPEALKGIENFGLGARRTLAEYEAFSGIDYKRRLINGKPGRIADLPAGSPERKADRKRRFTFIKESNGWGCEETASGGGSTMAQTEAIRRDLPGVFDSLNIRILGDAGCGDLNWISHITGGLQAYLGFDIVDSLINEAREKFYDRRNHFFSQVDIVIDALPECDAIICRDCLTHLDHQEILPALKLFKESGSRYLFATTHFLGKNTEIKTGGWFPIDLTAAPFNLPKPLITISEEAPNSTKSLGAWKISDLL